MRNNGIRIVRTRKYKATTDSNHRFNISPNWLDRNFMADRPNQKWAADISYIWTREGWLYLAVMIDLHSRRVVGWAVSNRLKYDLALQALDRAVALQIRCQAAFITPIVAANIALTIIRSGCGNWDSKYQ